jgi:hypothetical protein
MTTSSSERMWSQAMDDGLYDYDQSVDSDPELIDIEEQEYRLRKIAYHMVYVDESSPLSQARLNS